MTDPDFYKDIIDNLYDGVYFVDRQRKITYWNHGAERITGYGGEQVIGRSCSDNVLNHVTASGVQLCKGLCPLAACMRDGEVREADVFLHHADGHRVPVLVRAAPLRDPEGKNIGAVETFSNDTGDRSVRKELHQLRRTVQTDELTALGNRRYMMRRLRGLLAELGQQTDMMAALLFIDLDHFKHFNDRHGHAMGDRALQVVSATLRHNLRPIDVIARWGGDELLVILYDMASRDEAASVAERLRILVENSSPDLGDAELRLSISIGATLFLPSHIPDSVVQRADALMLQAKRLGGNHMLAD